MGESEPPGAEPEPDTHAVRRAGRARWRWAVPIALVATGVLLATSQHAHPGRSVADTTHDRLANLVAAQQRSADAATAEQRALRAQVDALASAEAGTDARVAAQQSAAAALAGPAGLTAVTGPAYRVSLDDAPKGAPVEAGYPAPTPDDLVVHQQDVQAVVNALWAGGARAMTIMDQRVVSTSAVRCVGNTLLLQGRVYSPPFVVTAVGDPARLAASLDAAPAVQIYRQYVHVYGLRLSTRTLDAVTLPAFTGPLAVSYASPLPSAATAARSEGP
ncbi:MAG: DUF881 domain-containing protein [Mycobacteriales bacterium]